MRAMPQKDESRSCIWIMSCNLCYSLEAQHMLGKKSEINFSFDHKIDVIFENFEKKELRLYVPYLLWKYSTLKPLTLLLMRKNLTGAWSKVGASKNHSVLSQKTKITRFKLRLFIESRSLNNLFVSVSKDIFSASRWFCSAIH